MSRRDSDSKRRGSRFDPQPSPKRYRKDGKQERGRVRTASNVQNGGHTPHHALHHSNLQADTQQEERGSAGQVGRSSGQRKAGERGWWKDIRNQHNEKEEISQGREQSEEKSQAKPDDNTSHRRGGFSDRKVDQPPTSRKGPAFREKNIPVDSENVNLTATVTVKSSQFDHPLERKERREKAAIHTIWTDLKSNLQMTEHPTRIKPGEGFPSRERHRGNGGNANSKGRDKFNGRQCYLPSKIQTEEWKHALYQDGNKDPIPQNEDDQIAKLEALLAS